MEKIGNSVYTKEVEDQDKEDFDDNFYLEALSSFPLVAYKYKINKTLYDVNSAITYFYHHGDHIYLRCNDGFCMPVDQSWIFLLHDVPYQFIEGLGTEVPTIEPGELLFCEETRREQFDIEKVDEMEVN